jgi:hypothetical protein
MEISKRSSILLIFLIYVSVYLDYMYNLRIQFVIYQVYTVAAGAQKVKSQFTRNYVY